MNQILHSAQLPCRDLAEGSRRAAAWRRQVQRREREAAARQRTAALQPPWGGRGKLARRLGLAPRTLRSWRHRRRRGELVARPLGRPCRESTRCEKLTALHLLHQLGPHVGLPSLTAAMPGLPRCQWIDLQRSYRRWWRTEHRCGQQRLTWIRCGSVWAIDFSHPPQPIAGGFQRILAVRDLASGMQLAWAPVLDESASSAIPVLAALLAEHGAPLVLKSDNGSAFLSKSYRQLLQRHEVVALYSPPRTPRYNGACEAGNGALKTHTWMLAAAQGRCDQWAVEDLQAAQHQANHSPTTRRETPHSRWRQAPPVSEQERADFQKTLDEQRTKVHNQQQEAAAKPRNNLAQAARQERKAITQALLELGLLSVTWRSIPLPIHLRNPAPIP